MNKVMSLKKRELFQSGIVGVMWIISGVIGVLNINGNIDIIASFVFLIAMIASIRTFFYKSRNTR